MEETYKLSDLMDAISQTISEEFGGPYWITAELAAAHNKSKGYWVLELQESNDRGQKLAQTQALVWATHVPRVVHKFERATGQKLSAGMRVRIRVQASFHAQWGFRLTVEDIDTAWTLGEAQANDDKIRKTLQDEGLWGKNKKLPTPTDFFRLAIVAPDTSAGLEDFLREAEMLKLAGLLDFDLFISPFEGVNAAKGIPAAFEKLVASNQPYDAVCVVRGGGAASGIAWLNQDSIVRAVCQCPFPVLSGIGHERDQTLVDEVANVMCGTPSKTIGYVATLIVQNAQSAAQSWASFQQGVDQRLGMAHQRLDEQLTMVADVSQAIVDRAKTVVDGWAREAVGLGPLSTLARGYAVVQDQNGKLVKSKNQTAEGDALTVRFADGSIGVVVGAAIPTNGPAKKTRARSGGGAKKAISKKSITQTAIQPSSIENDGEQP